MLPNLKKQGMIMQHLEDFVFKQVLALDFLLGTQVLVELHVQAYIVMMNKNFL